MSEDKIERDEKNEIDGALSGVFCKVKENPKILCGSKTLYGLIGVVLVAIFLL